MQRYKAAALTEDPLEVDPEAIWRLAEVLRVSDLERRSTGICIFLQIIIGCCRGFTSSMASDL